MAIDPELLRHKEWLGLLQPEGLVVSPPALANAQAFVDRGKAVELQPVLQSLVSDQALGSQELAWVPDFVSFAEQVLEWEAEELIADLPESLEVVLTDYGETLKPTYGVVDPDGDGWLLLVQEVPAGHDLDRDDQSAESGHGWKATYQQKFERLLKGVKIPIGILWNSSHLRLVYAPQGESSGHLTFPIQAMTEVPGRLILGALEMLLGNERLFNASSDRTLRKLLEQSRNYQAEVSTKLAEQVLDALWELLRGFQAADADLSGGLLRELAQVQPQHIYGGLITTLMRLVFLLYAEDQGLMPDDTVYQGNYSVAGLYDKLREDAGNYPDTMDQRYGAWAWLLSLFRLVYDGGGAYEAYLPARHGQLFDPDEYPFLEGRSQGSQFKDFGKLEAPRIADGVIYRILAKLLVLDGERLSYRALDVEQIGSVYEAVMGYEVEVAHGRSIAVRPKDAVVDLDAVLAVKPAERGKLLKDAECELKGAALNELKAATTVEGLVAAVGRKVSHRTPNLLPVGSFYLQPGEERRRSGSHYTPRKLTQPIVEKTLEPVLRQFGEHPTPEQLLDLKICDLAMGSAAFLVEACRQLADKLVEAWSFHGKPADLPDAVEEVVVARRLVAQRCLYGVDKNPFAVNLARLSLWLVTLAKDLPFTFLDHALKCGDSLVGLTRAEIGSFGANAFYEPTFFEDHKRLMQQSATKALSFRQVIQTTDTRTDGDAEEKLALLQNVERTLAPARLTAKVAVASFFTGTNTKERKQNQEEFGGKLIGYEKGLVAEEEIQSVIAKLDAGTKAVLPFNWELEFPEVFERTNPGFDAIVGNPPFLGGKKVSGILGSEYLAWVLDQYPEAKGNADLVAHFFRRAFSLIRKGGAFGLIATNTIAQGDTRSSGLRFICQNGGTIYHAQKRLKWPGLAAVVVSVVNIFKGHYEGSNILDNRTLDKITAFLFHDGGNEDPAVLLANANKSFIGNYVLGMGFTFDDTNPEATPIAEMHRLIEKDPRNAERVFPYIGGDEVNSSPIHAHNRYAINFFDLDENQARKWPDLMDIVERKVKPERTRINSKGEFVLRSPLPQRWWQYADKRPALVKAIAALTSSTGAIAQPTHANATERDRVLVSAQTSKYRMLTFLPTGYVYDQKLVVFAFNTYTAFTTLHSRIHEIWVIFMGSSMKDDPVYTPTDCFQTFPFPNNWENNISLEDVGKTYYEFRAELMIRNNQGLTDTYNRFHDPDENDPNILKLRNLHSQMDRAVLDAYGWTDISTDCEFFLDYEDDEVESSSKRKKPWRYRWPETTHDEVLARLLKLNQKRHEEEILGGIVAKPQSSGKKRSTKQKKSKDTLLDYQLHLIPPDNEQLTL